MVQQVLHRTRGVEHIGGACQDDDIRFVQSLGYRGKICIVGTLCFILKAVDTSAAIAAEIPGEHKLGNFAAEPVRKHPGNVVGRALMALAVDNSYLQKDTSRDKIGLRKDNYTIKCASMQVVFCKINALGLVFRSQKKRPARNSRGKYMAQYWC